MLKVLCFDLDGTLLPMDSKVFIRSYMKELALYMEEILPQDKLVPLIWDATETMIGDPDGSCTNEQVFTERFLSQAGLKRGDLADL